MKIDIPLFSQEKKNTLDQWYINFFWLFPISVQASLKLLSVLVTYNSYYLESDFLTIASADASSFHICLTYKTAKIFVKNMFLI